MDLLTPEDFEPWIGKPVRVGTAPHPVELTLHSIEQRPAHPGQDFRAPFSLFFEAPMAINLVDASYTFDCGRGGPHVLTITQLMPAAGIRCYQAVFG